MSSFSDSSLLLAYSGLKMISPSEEEDLGIFYRNVRPLLKYSFPALTVYSVFIRVKKGAKACMGAGVIIKESKFGWEGFPLWTG